MGLKYPSLHSGLFNRPLRSNITVKCNESQEVIITTVERERNERERERESQQKNKRVDCFVYQESRFTGILIGICVFDNVNPTVIFDTSSSEMILLTWNSYAVTIMFLFAQHNN